MSKGAQARASTARRRDTPSALVGTRRSGRSVVTGVPVHRELDELRRGVEIELLFDSLTMRFDGLHAQVQVTRYFASRLASSDQVEHLDLAVAQAVDRIR